MMSTTAPKSVTTPILVPLSEPEFETFIRQGTRLLARRGVREASGGAGDSRV
jgi:hypothetical protein